jgi:hypothetical protein
MRTLILAVIVAGIVEGFFETVREHRRVARVIAETNAALVERADEIDAKRERMIEKEFVA